MISSPAVSSQGPRHLGRDCLLYFVPGGPGKAVHHGLTNPRFTAGSSPPCMLLIPSFFLARAHCYLSRETVPGL
eukprot:12882110-Prorocentrum_lima.AAC.1